jgi:hypothetical protein
MTAVRLCACFLASCAAAWCQAGVPPKNAAADYPAHAQAGEVAIGAEYLVHSFSYGGQTFFAPDYLVVEVAVFPAKDKEIELSAASFALRMNGKKGAMFPEPAGFVAASLKYPDWEYRRTLEAGAGAGNTDVILGRPEPVPRFPGDRREQERRGPQRPRAPAEVSSGVEKQETPAPAEAVVESALPEGPRSKPAAGHLYFRYKGKTKSIKSLELLYRQGERWAALKLF